MKDAVKQYQLSTYGRRAATTLALLVGLLCSAMAFAVPPQLTQQGRLLNDAGEPVSGTVEMRFVIYDAAEDGAMLWEQVRQVELNESGYYNVTLGGAENPLDALVLEGGQRWLAVAIGDGEELSPRFELNSVPYATIAGQAETVADGAVGTASLADDFQLPADQIAALGWSKLLDVPADLADGDDDTLASLGCSAAEVAVFDGSNWSCAVQADTLRDTSCSAGEIISYDGTSWVCTAPSTDWADLTSVPADLADGDADTLALLGCAANEVATFDGANWSCAIPSVDWLNIANVPADLADGDDNTDTLAALNCAADQVATFDGTTWGCTSQTVDWSYITNMPADIADGDNDTDTDTLAALGCSAGQLATFDGTTWGCATPSVDWSNIANVPADIADGDDDTDTLATLNCSSSQVPQRNSVTGAWECSAMTVSLTSCQRICADAPTWASCPAGKVMRGIAISEMHGDESVCANLDDYEIECCSLQIR